MEPVAPAAGLVEGKARRLATRGRLLLLRCPRRSRLSRAWVLQMRDFREAMVREAELAWKEEQKQERERNASSPCWRRYFLKIWTSFRRSFRVSLKDVAEALKGCCWQCLGWGENCGEDLPQGG